MAANGASSRSICAGRPLIALIGIAHKPDGAPSSLLENAEPVTFLLVGSRQAPAGRPPGMSVFNVFFDCAGDSPVRDVSLAVRAQARARHQPRPARTVAIGNITIGPFAGELQFTFYAGARLVHMETIVRTREDRRAILYDTGLTWSFSEPEGFAWVDTHGKPQRAAALPTVKDHPIAAKHRTLIRETATGSLACFPPPHQFFFPRDLTDNLPTLWLGQGHRGLEPKFGFGIRQSERGGGSYVPWFNAPPGTDQHLGVFYLLSSGRAEQALDQTLKYTNSDCFPKLPGYHTLSSHWHMATAMAALEAKQADGPRRQPDFVRMFENMGVSV